MKDFTFYFLVICLFCLMKIGSIDAQVIFTEDFESTASGSTLPAGFTIVTSSTDGGYAIGTPGEGSSLYWTIPASGGQLAYSNDDVCNCDKSNDKLILPTQNLTGYTNVTLTSSVFNNGAYDGTGEVEVSTDNGVTWTSVYDIPTNTTAFQTITVELNAYAGMPSVQVAFRYNDAATWGSGFAVDDMTLEQILCGAPTSLAASNITDTTADIAWTDGIGCAANNTITVSPAITGSPFTVACGTETLSLTGLTGNKDYTVTIANDCGTTPSESFVFTSAISNDDCSSATVMTCGETLVGETNVGSTDNGDAAGCAMGVGVWYSFAGLDGDVAVTVDADFDTEISVSSSSDCITFTNISCADSGNPETATFSAVSGTTYYFYIANYWGTSTITGIFDISVDCVTCTAPTGTTASNVTNIAADITWTDGTLGCTANHTVTVSPAIPGSPFNVPCGTESLSLTSLAPTTTYTITVANDCDVFPSETIMFTTAANCDIPTNIAANNIETTTADITWTDGPGCAANNVIAVSPAIAGSPFTVACGTETLSLAGLTGNTDYTVTIANDCGAAPGESYMFTSAISNDDCSSATVMICGATLVGETNAGSTDNGDAAGCAMGVGVWYSFEGVDGDVAVTVDANFDTEISVSSSSDCITFTNISCTDSGNPETATFPAVSGTTYYFYIADYWGSSTVTGTFDISVDCVTCTAPTGTAASNITNVAADITWTDGTLGCMANHTVTVSPAITGSPFNVPCGTEILSLTGLTAVTTYTITVANDCDVFPGETIMFTTAPNCDVPTNITASNIGGTTADITWTDGIGCTANHTVIVSPGIVGPPFTVACGTETLSLTGMAENTDYIVIISNDCGTSPNSNYMFSTTLENDNCANATVMTCGETLTGETTVGATDNGDTAGCAMGRGVWYSFAGIDGDITVTVDASFGSEISISSSSDCTAFTNISCTDLGNPEIATFTSVSGTTYYFYIAHWSGTGTITGTFDISVDCVTCTAPTATAASNITNVAADITWTDGTLGCTANHTVTVSPAIPGSPFNVPCGTETLSLTGLVATTAYSVTVANDCDVFPSETMMFTTAANCDIPTNITASNVGTTTANVTWTDGIGCSANNTITVSPAITGSPFTVACGTETLVLSGLTLGTTYTVTVANDCGAAPSDVATFTTPLVENDACDNATVITCGTTLIGETNVGATDNGDAAGCGMGVGVWYTFAGNDMGVTIEVDAPFDSEISVSSSSDCTTFTNISCTDSGNPETTTFETVSGTTYYIYVAHYSNISTTTGIFDLSVTCVSIPTNDDCINAIALTCGASRVGESTVFATDNGDAAGCDMGKGLWYSFVGNDMDVSIEVDADFDSEISVSSSSDCTTFTNISCTDSGNPETTTFSAAAGTTYYIYVAHWLNTSTTTGTFDISLTSCVVVCTEAVNLPSTGTTTSSGACEDGTWTYYSGSAAEYIFAIEWDPTAIGGGHNAAAKAAAAIAVQVDAIPNSQSNASTGTFFMGRQWDVDLGIATLDGPVNIKFYYDPTEKSDAEAASAAHAAANGTTDNGFQWFKQTGSANFSTMTDAVFQPDVYLEIGGTGTESGITYVQLNDISSFSSGSGGAGSGDGALPVEFTSFTGNADKNVNLLNWVTASEGNSSHYEIERSANGVDFENIGRVSAAGTSTEILNYNFIDEKPFVSTYYRLKQVDLDDKYDYSETINIRRSDIGNIFIGSIRPNPTKGTTMVQFDTKESGQVNILLTDINGKIITSQQFESISGTNQKELNLGGFASGIYFLSISNDQDKVVTRIVKSD